MIDMVDPLEAEHEEAAISKSEQSLSSLREPVATKGLCAQASNSRGTL